MGKEFNTQVLRENLILSVKESLQSLADLELSSEPEVNDRDIIEYQGKMRVFGLDKFNGPCYISVINFYRTAEEMKKEKAIGAYIFFVDVDVAERLFKSMGLEGMDPEDDAIMFDGCGEVCNILAGALKNDLNMKGYKELVISAPSSHKNDVAGGVAFSFDQYTKQEFVFELWNKKAFVVEVTLADVPNVR